MVLLKHHARVHQGNIWNSFAVHCAFIVESLEKALAWCHVGYCPLLRCVKFCLVNRIVINIFKLFFFFFFKVKNKNQLKTYWNITFTIGKILPWSLKRIRTIHDPNFLYISDVKGDNITRNYVRRDVFSAFLFSPIVISFPVLFFPTCCNAIWHMGPFS